MFRVSAMTVFKTNLRQLSFCVAIADDKSEVSVNCLSLSVRDTSVELNVEQSVISLALDANDGHSIAVLDTTSLRQLSVQTIDSPHRCVQISFVITAKFDTFPQKPIFANVLLPPNFEILDDWIFCHNHSHNSGDDRNPNDNRNEANDHLVGIKREHNDSKQSKSRPPKKAFTTGLTSLSQILRIMSTNNSLNCQYLFECENHNLSLYLKIVNRDLIASCFTDLLIAKNSDVQRVLVFRNVLFVKFKIFKHPKQEQTEDDYSELLTYRHSFQVEWFLIDVKLFYTLMQNLINSSKTILPLDSKFELIHSKNSFVSAYLDLNSDSD